MLSKPLFAWFGMVCCVSVAAAKPLGEIVLVENPTGAQVADYLSKIRANIVDPSVNPNNPAGTLLVGEHMVSGRSENYSVPYEDPLVMQKLAVVLPAQLEALLRECEAITPGMHMLKDEIFLRSALACVRDHPGLGDTGKQTVRDHLVKLPLLLDRVIVARKWVFEFEPAIAKAAYDIEYYQDVFATLLIQLPSPEARDAVVHLLTQKHGFIMARCYKSARRVRPSALDWDGIAKVAWPAAKKTADGRRAYAPVAARHGYVDALVVFADVVREQTGLPELEKERADEFAELVPGEFKDAAARAKFVKQRAKLLVFDPASGTYRVP